MWHSHQFPLEILLINQDPHQLRNCQGWVGVIQLDGNLDVHNNELSAPAQEKAIYEATASWEAFLF